MKGKNKKIVTIVICFGLLLGIIFGITVLVPRVLNKTSSKFNFVNSEAFYLGDNNGGMGECITIGEYLVYAASIVQTSTQDYGSDVWIKIVQDDEGNDISFEEYIKKEIVNQIRTTHILNMNAEEYEQSLSEDELSQISKDAQSYYDTLAQFDIGKTGIDLALILNIYKQNAIAEKVYNAIIADVAQEEGMTEDEYKDAKIHYFDSETTKLEKESCKNWSYDVYVNKKALSELSFSSLYSKTEDNSDGVSSSNDINK